MIEPASVITALLLGLAGNVHCFGMCGGIMAALAFREGKPSFTVILGYNLGRISSYALIGALAGTVTAFLQQQWPVLLPVLRSIAGLLVIAMGIYLAGWANLLAPLESLGNRVWARLPHPSLGQLRNGQFFRALGAGMAWGWLPCGLVYSTLAWTTSQGDTLTASVLMLAFGVGTLPGMLATGLFASRLRGILQARGFRQATGLLVIAFGIWTLALPLLPGAHGHHHAMHQEAVPVPAMPAGMHHP